MAEIVLRTAVPADAAAVLAFWQVAAEDTGRPSDSRADVERLVARDSAALLLAVDGDDVVGSVIIGWDGWRCHLYRLAVDPDRRRQGIGRELVARAEARFTSYGGTRADAMVLDDNDLAHAVWAAAGYTRQAEWSRWVRALP